MRALNEGDEVVARARELKAVPGRRHHEVDANLDMLPGEVSRALLVGEQDGQLVARVSSKFRHTRQQHRLTRNRERRASEREGYVVL